MIRVVHGGTAVPLQWMAPLMLGWLIGSWVLMGPFSGAGANGIQTYPFYNRACLRARGSGWYKLVDDYVKQMSASLVRPQE